jgi:hypothetical protein
LLRHKFVFRAHPPDENGTEDDEKKDEGAAADNLQTGQISNEDKPEGLDEPHKP